MGLCTSKDAVVVDGDATKTNDVSKETKPEPQAESAGERDGEVQRAAADLVRTSSSGRCALFDRHFRSF